MNIYISNELNNKVSLLSSDKKNILLATLNKLENVDDFSKIQNLKKIRDSNIFEIKTRDLRLFLVKEENSIIIIDLVIDETSTQNNQIFSQRINPLLNHEYNPIFNHSINPVFNHNINPIFNHNINPIFNHSINPIFNHSINPVFNSMINPFRNTMYEGSLLFDKNNTSLGFGIVVNNDCEIFYSNDLKIKFYSFSVNEQTRICFENNKLYGLIVKANERFSLLYQNNEHIMNIIK